MANLPSTPLPSSRSISYGDFPVKTFMSQSGIEYRIKYGTKRAGMVLSLSYKNITDSEAETFLDHYHGQSGTFERFNLSDATRDAGWEGSNDALGAGAWSGGWRYQGPPTITQVSKGISTISFKLVSVLMT